MTTFLNADIQSTDLTEHKLGHTLDEIYNYETVCKSKKVTL